MTPCELDSCARIDLRKRLRVSERREQLRVCPDDLERETWGAFTSSCVQPPPTSVALEMLCLLMRNQELEIFKISLAVVTPWSRQELLDVGLLSLLLAHLGGFRLSGLKSGKCRCRESKFRKSNAIDVFSNGTARLDW
jgi:hypothetical protein